MSIPPRDGAPTAIDERRGDAPGENDASLGRRFRDGDNDALAALYIRHYPAVYRFVAARAADPAVAEDLAQAAFLHAWEHRRDLRNPARFKPWLLASARNLAIDDWRQRQHLTDGDGWDERPASANTEESALAGQTPELMWAAVATLPQRQREVLRLAVREGLTSAEIGVVFGISAGHAAVLVHRSKRALRAAVRALLLATGPSECPGLRRIVPGGIRRLTEHERAAVDRHMRRCAVCRSSADRLTDPVTLFGALPLIALPIGWEVRGLAALHHAATGAAAAGAGAGAAGAGRHTSLGAVAAGVAAVAVALTVVALTRTGAVPAASPATHPPAPAATVAALRVGRVLVSGDDPDYHAHFGPNAAGARRLIQLAVAYVTASTPHPHLLLVTGLAGPAATLHGDPRLGLADAGFTFDVASDTPGRGIRNLATVRFADYDAVVVASDFGGWLSQHELDTLIARRADLVAYLKGGGGLVAFAEGGAAGKPGEQPLTTHGYFAFLPAAWAVAPLAEYEVGVMITPAGAALGLTPQDEAGNYLHSAFTAPSGAHVLAVDGAGRAVAFTLTADLLQTS